MNYSKGLRGFVSRSLPLFYSLPALLWQVLFLCVPLAIIIYFSFTYQADIYTLTLAPYKSVFNSIHFKVIIRSLIMALGTAGICLLMAYPVAYFLALRVSDRWKNILLFFVTLPMWTNFLVQIYAWFFLLERSGLVNKALLNTGLISESLHLSNNMFAVFLVMIYCYLPFMVMPLYSVLSKLDTSLLEASSDLGATSWQTFMRVTLPLSLPGIRTGFLLVLVPAFGEFAIPALIGGSKYLMVGSLISYYFLIARNTALGAAFTCLSGAVLFIVAGLFYWYFKLPYVQEKRMQDL